MRAHGVIPLTAAIAVLFLAVLVYRAAPDRTVGRTFSLLGISLVFWNLNFFALYAFVDYNTALKASQIFRTVGIFVLPCMLHLTLVLPGRAIPRSWIAILVLDYALTVVLAIANIRGLFVTRLAAFDWGYYSVGTPFYNLFAYSVLANFVISTYAMFKYYVTTDSPRMRLQLKFWLFGLACAVPLGLTNLLPAYGIRFYPLGNLGSAVWATIVGYAIVRYRLMDIEVVVAKTLANSLVLLLCGVPIFVIVAVIQYRTLGEINYSLTTALFSCFAVMTLAFSRLRPHVEQQLQRLMFPNKYETRAALVALGSETVRILDRDELYAKVCDALKSAFGTDRVAMYVRSDLGTAYEALRVVGEPVRNRAFTPEDPLVRWIASKGEAVLRDEADLEAGEDSSQRVIQTMLDNGWEVCVPFVSGPELVGFACIGRKRALQAYVSLDLQILSQIAGEITIAIQNARLYSELRRSREIINRTGRLSALGTLAAGIAHEIRNPLVSIQTFFQLAPERADDEEFMSSFLKLAEAEVQRISALISELLAFAKSPVPSLGEVDLNEVSERAVLLLEPQAKSLGVDLVYRSTESLPSVIADPDRVMQVVLNIALNGLQASSRGGSVIIETRVVPGGSTLFCQLGILDHGIGMPASVKENIFNPFFTTKEKGTGLGLAIAHQIVVESGGFISVESAEGEGSQFLVHFPVHRRDEVEGGAVC